MLFSLLRRPSSRQSLGILAILILSLASAVGMVQADQVERDDNAYIIAGRLIDSQDQPVVGARITVGIPGDEEPLEETESQEDGNWALMLDE